MFTHFCLLFLGCLAALAGIRVPIQTQLQKDPLVEVPTVLPKEGYAARSELLGLLKTIGDNKLDDTPRLVASDWEEENGHSQHAEFIRVQLRLFKLEGEAKKLNLNSLEWHEKSLEIQELRHRTDALLKMNYQFWIPEWIQGAQWYHFERGYLESVTLSPSRFIQFGPPIVAYVPSLQSIKIARKNTSELHWFHIFRNPQLFQIAYSFDPEFKERVNRLSHRLSRERWDQFALLHGIDRNFQPRSLEELSQIFQQSSHRVNAQIEETVVQAVLLFNRSLSQEGFRLNPIASPPSMPVLSLYGQLVLALQSQGGEGIRAFFRQLNAEQTRLALSHLVRLAPNAETLEAWVLNLAGSGYDGILMEALQNNAPCRQVLLRSY